MARPHKQMPGKTYQFFITAIIRQLCIAHICAHIAIKILQPVSRHLLTLLIRLNGDDSLSHYIVICAEKSQMYDSGKITKFKEKKNDQRRTERTD